MRHPLFEDGHPSEQGLPSTRRKAPQRLVPRLQRRLFDLLPQRGFLERAVSSPQGFLLLALESLNAPSYGGDLLQQDGRVGVGEEQVARHEGMDLWIPRVRSPSGQAVQGVEDVLPD